MGIFENNSSNTPCGFSTVGYYFLEPNKVFRVPQESILYPLNVPDLRANDIFDTIGLSEQELEQQKQEVKHDEKEGRSEARGGDN